MKRILLAVTLLFFTCKIHADPKGQLFQLSSMMARNIQDIVEKESKKWWHPTNIKEPLIHVITAFDQDPFSLANDSSESGISFIVKFDYTDLNNKRIHKTLKTIKVEQFAIDPMDAYFHQEYVENLIAADILYGYQDSIVEFIQNNEVVKNPNFRPVLFNYFSEGFIDRKPFVEFIQESIAKRSFQRINNELDIDTLIELSLNKFFQYLSRKSKKISDFQNLVVQPLELLPEELSLSFPETSRLYELKIKVDLIGEPFLHDFQLRLNQEEIEAILNRSISEASELVANKIISTINYEIHINPYLRNKLGIPRLFTDGNQNGCGSTFK